MAITTLQQLVKADLAAHQPLINYFTAAGRPLSTAIFPRADETPSGSVPTPFLVISIGAVTGDILLHGNFGIYIYDSPNQFYWRIEDIKNIIHRLFDHKRLASTAPGSPHYNIAFHQVTTSQRSDDAWNLNFMLTRFSVTACL